MAVDKGSLRYRIELEASDALLGLRNFRAGLIQARQSWRNFKRDLRSTDADARAATSGLRGLADAARRVSEEAREQERTGRRRKDQSRDTARELKREGEETSRLADSSRRLAFEQRRIRELKRGIGREQISIGSEEIKRLETSLGLLRQIHAAELRLIRARRISGTGRDIKTAATFDEERELALLRARNQLERTQTVESDRQLQDARAELAAAQALLRVEQQRLTAEKLRGRGALPSGRTVDQAAREALQREKEALAVKDRQSQLEAQQTAEVRAQTQEIRARIAAERTLAAQEIRRLRERAFIQRGLLSSGTTAEETAARLRQREAENLRVKKAQADQEALQTDEERAQLRALEAELAVQRALLRVEQQRLTAEKLRATGRTARGLSVQEAARDAFQQDLERLRVQQLRRQLQEASPEFLRLRSELQGTGREAVVADSRLRTLGATLDRLGGRGNRLSFTFRRLIGILAAFAAARAVVRVFRDAIAEQVRFSAQLEQTELGIASLITAVSEVRTATGGAADASERLALSQEIARRQLGLLRKDALRTVATFRELSEAFEIAIAPGVGAGLDLDEIRNFTLQISQAAASLGLQGNQLAEEIRSILSGTIQLRTTRIAAALGITNEDIRRAKELGILSEFLNERFEAFTVAGENALTLFNAVVSNLQDAFGELLRQGGIEFFEELKALLTDTLDLLIDTGAEGIEINPEALEVVRGIFTGLTRAVQEARRLRESLDFEDAAALGQGLGSILGTAAEIIGAIIEGFLKGAKDLARILAPIASFFRELFPEDSGKEFLTRIIRILTIIGGLTLVLSTALSLLGLMVLPAVRFLSTTIKISTVLITVVGLLKKMPAELTTIRAISVAILNPWVLLGAAVAVVLFEIGRISLEVAGIELKFETVIRLVRVGLVGAMRFAAASIKVTWITLTNSMASIFFGLTEGIRRSLFGIFEAALKAAGFFGAEVDEQLKRLEESRIKSKTSFDEDQARRAQEIKEAGQEFADAMAEAAFEGVQGFADALEKNDTAKTFEEFFSGLKAEIAKGFGELIPDADGLADGLDASSRSAKDLVSRLRDLPGIVGRGDKQVEGLQDALAELTEELAKAQESLTVSIRAEGTGDFTREAVSAAVEQEFRLRKDSLAVTREIEALDLQRAGTQARLRDLVAETAKQNLVTQTNIERAVSAGQDLINIEQELRAAEQRRTVLIAQQTALQKQGREEAADALGKDIEAQQQRIDELRDALGFIKGFLRQSSAVLEKQGGDKLLQLVEDRVSAAGQERSAAEDAANLAEDRATVEAEINQLLITRVEELARRQIEQSRERLRIAEAELRGQEALSAFTSTLKERTPEVGLAESQAALDVERARLEVLLERLVRQRQVNQDILRDLRARGATEEQIAQVIQAQVASQRELQVETARQELASIAALQRLNEEKRKLAEPVTFGLEKGLADFVENSRNQFEAWRQIATSALEGFAATSAEILTAALDPTRDTSALEAFGQLFLNIFQQALQNLIQQGMAELLAGLIPKGQEDPGVSLAAAAILWKPIVVGLNAAALTLTRAAAALAGAGVAAVPAGVSQHLGGPIPRSGLPSTAHRHARGAISGMRIPSAPAMHRPSWVHPRDTTPLWGEPGEWVIRTRAVRKYGNEFFQAANEGRLSSHAARALLEASRTSPHRRPSAIPSLQSGGTIPANIAASLNAGRDPIILPVLVADEQAHRRLLAAGPKAQAQWIKENSNEQQVSLGRR